MKKKLNCIAFFYLNQNKNIDYNTLFFRLKNDLKILHVLEILFF